MKFDEKIWAEKALERWARIVHQRDDIILAAIDVGVPLRQITRITGVSRSTIWTTRKKTR